MNRDYYSGVYYLSSSEYETLVNDRNVYRESCDKLLALSDKMVANHAKIVAYKDLTIEHLEAQVKLYKKLLELKG